MATGTQSRRIPLEVKASIRDRYEHLREMTEEELAAAVAALPDATREELASGPEPSRYACRVCTAFPRHAEPDDRTDPAYLVFAYHEIPKLDMLYDEQAWYGEHANETYRRCIATYRAAGWTGEAQEPNA